MRGPVVPSASLAAKVQVTAAWARDRQRKRSHAFDGGQRRSDAYLRTTADQQPVDLSLQRAEEAEALLARLDSCARVCTVLHRNQRELFKEPRASRQRAGGHHAIAALRTEVRDCEFTWLRDCVDER